jgi:hypothetical protein
MSFDPNRPTAPQPGTPAPFTPTQPEGSGVPTTPVQPTMVTAAPSAGPGKRKTSSGGGRLLNLVLVVAAAVAIGGVAFAVGRGTAPVSAATGAGRGNFGNGGGFPGGSFAPGASGQPGRGFGGGFGGFGGGGLTVRGTVESVDANSLTIKTANGQTITVATGASTTYNTQSPASASDVQAGKTVQVQLDFGAGGRPRASATTTGPVGTAGSVTVVP